MSSGKIAQVVGPVVDVAFAAGEKLPEINNALVVYTDEEKSKRIVLEVALELGEGVVRTIAMESTDGLTRGLEVLDTGRPISVPVGKDTLGRVFNVLGDTIDLDAPFADDADGIIVPGGFGQRGTEGKIQAIRYARENDVPMLGICLGMQLTCIEFARHVLHLDGANSAELDPETKYPIIDIMRDQIDIEDMGGTLRLGLYPCKLKPGSKAATAYGNQEVVQRRHRHRYEFNTKFREQFEAEGFVFSGVSPDNRLMEVVELPDKKFFVAAQYHPEYHSRPNHAEELYSAFVTAAVENAK